MSEEIEGRLTKKLSQENVPNMNIENEEPTKDRPWNDPHPEVDASVYQAAQPIESDREETSYMYTYSFA